ncbi:MAG: cation:proton antiporter, partial [Victivallales bacterium]|nr:cation:proton antiporter [Victivallales bacterium]
MFFPLCEMTASLNKLSLVQDLAAVMLVAGMVAALFHYLGWPKVIGYIAAGALMGLPQIKEFLIANEGSVNVLANLGIIFLMFTLGLELNIRKLRKIGNIVFPTAVCDIFLMLLAGYLLGHYVFGWSMLPSLFLGAVVCDSSTTLLAKSLDEIGCSKEPFADVIFGTTLTEDILTIGIMALLTGLAMTGTFQPNELVLQLALLLLFLVGVLGFGLILLPKFLDKLKRLKDDETLLVIILGICFGIAFVAEKMQFSLALGAFLVGAVVSESSVSKRVHESTAALRNMFSAVFFVTIGLMVNLHQMWANKWGILIVSALVIVCKTFNCLVASFVMGQTRHDAVKTGIGLAQIGDFAYLVALLGINLRNGAEPFPQMYQIAVGASIITTLVNPFMLRKAQKFANWLDRVMPSRMLRFLENYTVWTRRASSQVIRGEQSADFKKRLILYILDLVLVLVLFSIAHFISERLHVWFQLPRLIRYFKNELIWLATCIFSFPILISAFLHSRQMASALSMATSSAFRNERWSRAMRNI